MVRTRSLKRRKTSKESEKKDDNVDASQNQPSTRSKRSKESDSTGPEQNAEHMDDVDIKHDPNDPGCLQAELHSNYKIQSAGHDKELQEQKEMTEKAENLISDLEKKLSVAEQEKMQFKKDFEDLTQKYEQLEEEYNATDEDPQHSTLSKISEAEVGVIEKITLINFMCHTMLEVPLGSNVNFIIGRNGSGKSAILKAIMVGLGGNCGTSEKKLISNNCRYSQVSIQLRNRGEDAYQPDIFGRSIIVECHIWSDAATLYKIKSFNGETISNKMEDLVSIRQQFGIQVNNSVCVNQDTFTKLLMRSNPSDMYKFFLKAAQLEPMIEAYEAILKEAESHSSTLTRMIQTLAEMEKEMDKSVLQTLKKDKVLGKGVEFGNVNPCVFLSEYEFEKIDQSYQVAKGRIVDTTRVLRVVESLNSKRLKGIVDKQSSEYVDYRKFMAIRVKFFFQMMLSQRGYTRKIRFVHADEEVLLEVNVDNGVKDKGTDNTSNKSLSRSERIFSALCFVMSLWEALETPLRCLDGYDDSMDMVNHRISMDMMLMVAKEQSERQFIFFTSNDVSAVDGCPNVKIIKLKDPIREEGLVLK